MTLLEREGAQAAIAAALDRAAAGASATLFLVGEAGIGKSTLVEEACTRARSRGFALHYARCADVEASIPFSLIERIFDGASALATQPSARGGSPTDVLATRYVGLVDWLRHDAPRPLLIAVDDLQWSDPDSAALLAALCRRLSGVPVAVVAATRPWPSIAFEHARRLIDDGLASAQYLHSLSKDASHALLEAHGGGELSPELTRHAHERCAGNPLLLKEVAAAWARGDDLLASPASLSERIFLPRFAGVGPSAMRWARGACVLGTRFHPLLVTPLVGQTDLEASAALEALCDAGIVRATGDADAEFVHPLLRDALYDDLAVPVRQGLHARVFKLLRDRGAPDAEIAVHALAANLRGEPSAIDAVASAARAALGAGAVATAVDLFTGAIDLAGAAATSDLWLELGRACLLIGRVEQGERATRRFLAEEELDGAGRVAGMRLLAQILMTSARQNEALDCFEEASRLAEGFDPALAAEILLDSTFVGCVYQGPRRVRATTRRAFQLIEEYGIENGGLTRAATSAESYLACIGAERVDVAEMAGVLERLVSRPDVHELRTSWNWDPVFGYVRLAKIFERFDDELLAYPVLEDLTRRQGSTVTYLSYTVNHADTLWRLGRLDDAYRSLHDGIAMATIFPTIAPYASIGLAYLTHELGRREESAAWAQRVNDLMAAQGETAYLRLWLLLIACRDALSDGRVGEAVHSAELAEATAAQSGILEPCVVPWHGAAIEAYVAAGQLDAAWALATSLDAMGERLPCRAPRAVAAAGRASVHWRRGDVEAAEACYDEALSHNAAVAMPLADAETRIAYGRFLRHTRRTTRARVALHEALDVLEPTGAGRLIAVATEELAAAGGRPSRRRYRSSTELTAQEYRVASLAATGLTNKAIAQALFVSAKTVDHHLSATYAKLGIRSRRELMRDWLDVARVNDSSRS